MKCALIALTVLMVSAPAEPGFAVQASGAYSTTKSNTHGTKSNAEKPTTTKECLENGKWMPCPKKQFQSTAVSSSRSNIKNNLTVDPHNGKVTKSINLNSSRSNKTRSTTPATPAKSINYNASKSNTTRVRQKSHSNTTRVRSHST